MEIVCLLEGFRPLHPHRPQALGLPTNPYEPGLKKRFTSSCTPTNPGAPAARKPGPRKENPKQFKLKF